jgi:cation:H+ antiporter
MNGDFTYSILGFAICAGVVFLAGKKLSFYGDLLAEKTGLGRAWIGLILMSAVTSLPELIVGIGSAAIVQSADLAVGDIMGSCAFNLGILSLMDAFVPKDKPILGKASPSHVLAASLGMILMALTGLGLFLDQDIVLLPSIGLTSISFAVIYFISLRIIFTYNKTHPQPEHSESEESKIMTLRQVILGYSGFALIIIIAALFLPHFAEGIAETTGLGQAFVGSLFLAISTSLPEIAVSIAAVRIGAVDLAIGNLLGSNIFNIFILFLDDLFYAKGHILKDASEANIVSVFSVLIMSAIAVIGLSYQAPRKRFLLAWDTLMILVVYVLNMMLLYRYS